MAGRAVADPDLVAFWAPILLAAKDRMLEDRAKAKESEEAFRSAVRVTFDGNSENPGLTAKQIADITGYTDSRLYQIKGNRRT